MKYLSRLKHIQNYFEHNRFDAAFITHTVNIRYLCGFTGSSGVLTYCRGAWEFFTDGRYTEQARKQVKGAGVRVDALAPLAHAARSTSGKLKRSRGIARIAIECDYMTLAMQARLISQLEGTISKSKFRLVQTSG